MKIGKIKTGNEIMIADTVWNYMDFCILDFVG